MLEKMKLAVIGTGTMAQYHIAALKDNPRAELYAVCDVHEGRAKEAAASFGAEYWFTDMNEMLKMPEIDAVLVTTGNRFHAPCAIAALNAGKHVLCEKPMSVSTEDAIKMQEAAEQNGKLLMIGLEFRFSTDVAIVKEAIDRGQFGEVYYCKAMNHRRNGHPGGWFGNKKIAAGGVMVDCGVHLLDAFSYMTGSPKAVSVYAAEFNKIGTRPHIKSDTMAYKSAAASADDTSDVEDLASAMIRFDNGAVLALEASYAVNVKKDYMELSLWGTKAGSNFNGERLEIYSEMNQYLTNISFETSTNRDFFKLLRLEMDHFISCVQDGTECISPAENGVEMMRIIDAIYESAETGHEVIIKR